MLCLFCGGAWCAIGLAVFGCEGAKLEVGKLGSWGMCIQEGA